MSTYLQKVYQQYKTYQDILFFHYLRLSHFKVSDKYRHQKRVSRYISMYNKGLPQIMQRLLIMGPWEIVESPRILGGDFENVVRCLRPDLTDDLCYFSYQFG